MLQVVAVIEGTAGSWRAGALTAVLPTELDTVPDTPSVSGAPVQKDRVPGVCVSPYPLGPEFIHPCLLNVWNLSLLLTATTLNEALTVS